jgi:hypothetical protein
MPYILYKTNGNTLVTVDDGAVDATTSLTFVGKNYSGYGQPQNENFVKLLENFANTTAPTSPLQGQLWFNTNSSNSRLNVCFDGKSFKSLANVSYQETDPALSSSTQPLDGDMWWNTGKKQLNAWNSDAGTWVIVGPTTSSETQASWNVYPYIPQEDASARIWVMQGNIGYNPIFVMSDNAFTPQTTSNLWNNFKYIQPGINIAGANATTGVSSTGSGFGHLIWGTAANALTANTATTSVISKSNTSTTYYMPLVTTSTGISALYSTSTVSYNSYNNILNITATAAEYADLAERYEADAVYEEGTVLVIGGEKEVTTTNQFADTRVVGIVSKNPAYMMNRDAGTDETHPYIALKGRVPCKVVGYIEKGDILVTSAHPGYATAAKSVAAGSIIGKALRSQSEGFGVIEVLVV